MNDTGFNWKQVEIKTTAFDGTHRMNNSVQVPGAYRKPKISPSKLLSMMERVDHKGPIRHQIVSER